MVPVSNATIELVLEGTRSVLRAVGAFSVQGVRQEPQRADTTAVYAAVTRL